MDVGLHQLSLNIAAITSIFRVAPGHTKFIASISIAPGHKEFMASQCSKCAEDAEA